MTAPTQTFAKPADQSATTATPDLTTLKIRGQAVWSSGGCAIVGPTLQFIAEELYEAPEVLANENVFDVTAGNGDVSLGGIHRWCDVISTDYGPSLQERGRPSALAKDLTTHLSAPLSAHTLRSFGGRQVTVRPARPDDAGMLQSYVRGLSLGSRHNRFFGALSELPTAELDRLTRMDHPGQVTLIVETSGEDTPTMIGEARCAVLHDPVVCEFAISVAEAWRRKGLGSLLLGDLQSRVRALGVRTLVGDVLRSNETMLAFARKVGFDIAARSGDPRAVRIVKDIALFSAGVRERAFDVPAKKPSLVSDPTRKELNNEYSNGQPHHHDEPPAPSQGSIFLRLAPVPRLCWCTRACQALDNGDP
jgi:GNAT superfamily N-acetyltransferase